MKMEEMKGRRRRRKRSRGESASCKLCNGVATQRERNCGEEWMSEEDKRLEAGTNK